MNLSTEDCYMTNKWKRLLAGLLSLAVLMTSLSSVALAQQPTGAIEGAVTDPQGAVVPGASVTVKSKATNLTRTVTSNDEGQYKLSQLPPDTYEVRVAAPNFKTSVAPEVAIAVGANVALD